MGFYWDAKGRESTIPSDPENVHRDWDARDDSGWGL
jgi:hypothetical protein